MTSKLDVVPTLWSQDPLQLQVSSRHLQIHSERSNLSTSWTDGPVWPVWPVCGRRCAALSQKNRSQQAKEKHQNTQATQWHHDKFSEMLHGFPFMPHMPHMPHMPSIWNFKSNMATWHHFPSHHQHLGQPSNVPIWKALRRGCYIIIQVEPGKPGAEVSKKKNYKSKKKFAYRMCTGWPTTAMPKPFHGCGVLTCFDVVGCRVRSDIFWLVSECG